MVDKGCDNCYYTYFDEKAYPCSLCIRGVERTDQWQPSKKTKADTPQTDCENCAESGSYKCTKCDGEMYYKDAPQTERVETMSCEECKHYDDVNGHCFFIGRCTYEPKEQTERSE